MPCASASEERATLPYNSVQQKFVPKECPQRAASSSASKDDGLQRVYCKTVCHQILFQQCPPESVLHRRLRKLSQKGVSGECCTMVSHKGVLYTNCSARVPDRLPFTQPVRVSFRSVLRTVSYEVSYEVAPPAPLRSASLKKTFKERVAGEKCRTRAPQ